ncbi:DUF6124 family protein [Pseudomonas sp. DC3200b2]|uniref:DUF6124 family protein n=1 Tax=Pseudomonas sp. DC3200b2 TaxID=2804669 RepID=UPI003CECB1AE
MTPSLPFPLSLPFSPRANLDHLEALTQASSLLHCAAAVAYENADSQKGEARHLALGVVHLLGMAHALVIHCLDCGLEVEKVVHAEPCD